MVAAADPLAVPSSLEVWFDPICPWTYLGERQLTAALATAAAPPTP